MPPSSPGPRASVIIPNWNGARHLPDCLDSLRAQSVDDFEVVVVDNGSSDSSLTLLAQRYPWARVLALGENTGFPGAVNAGIRATDTPVVVLLNNDTRAEPDWLERLLAGLEGEPAAGFAACKMLLFDPPHVIDSAGDRYSLWRGAGVNIGAGAPRDRHARPAWVFGACAGAAAYRRSLLDDIGLFDEDFFLIFEDIDIDLRAQVAGYQCLYVPDAVVYHKRGASTDNLAPETGARAWRNLIWVAGNNLPPLLLLVWLVCFALRLAWQLTYAVLRRVLAPLRPVLGPVLRGGRPAAPRPSRPPGWWRIYLAALREGFVRLPAKRRLRRGVRRLGSVALLPILLRPVRPLDAVPRSGGSRRRDGR